MEIPEALALLDPTDDDHWTADGLPRMDVIENLMNDTSITRKDVTDAAPAFTRQLAIDAAAKAAEAAETEANSDNAAIDAANTPPVDATAEVPGNTPLVDAADEDEGLDPDHNPYDILEMSWSAIAKSEESINQFNLDAAVVTAEFVAKKKELEKHIASIGRVVQMTTRLLTRINNAKPQSDTKEIREYLAKQKEVREARAKRTKVLLDQGLTPAILAKAISGKSPLDAALNQRKPAPGSTRPNPRMPVQGTRQAGQ